MDLITKGINQLLAYSIINEDHIVTWGAGLVSNRSINRSFPLIFCKRIKKTLKLEIVYGTKKESEKSIKTSQSLLY